MDIRIADIVNDSIVDGKGIRLTVFTQGCCHNCDGCHNPGTHPIDGGKIIDTDKIIDMIKENPLLDGLTLSGGEPFLQCSPCTIISKATKDIGLNVWAYTGFKYEDILKNKEMLDLLENIDVLVDGKFDITQKSIELDFCGSSNQRLIDVQKSLNSNCIIPYIV